MGRRTTGKQHHFIYYRLIIKSNLIVTNNCKTINSRDRVALGGAKTTATMPYYGRIVLHYMSVCDTSILVSHTAIPKKGGVTPPVLYTAISRTTCARVAQWLGGSLTTAVCLDAPSLHLSTATS